MIVVKKIYLLLTIILFIPYCYGQAFTIARIHYNGGGDWYGDCLLYTSDAADE